MDKELEEALRVIKIKCHPNSNPSPLVDSALDTIKQALITKSKKEQAFDICKNKNVNIYLLKNAIEIYDYNSYYVTNDERLTQDEFDLLMEVLW